ncbi:alpha-2-macroglobulin-like protein 1 isoform X2 [Mixophyes fleayi]|uniref:alpha-2-macroglobulin-like protein 1 isoform X2 n=1 Tax=Mixophyes fleayi TaxID=3061075 RepID=UPI003F4DAF93
MVSRTLCLGLILLHISWTLASKLHYAVIFPSETISHHSETICINLEGAQGESRVQISLELGKKNTTLIDKSFQLDSIFSCLKLQFPDAEEIEEVGTLWVSIQNAEETVTKSSKVLVKKRRSSVLVQTDKPVYKPGQTVRFRILSLDEDLKPKNILLPVVELQDPEKNRIGQWLNVSLKQGIAELSLTLTSEPQLGEYSIKVKDTVYTFTVEKYVLPKFEVTFQFPKFVMFNCESFTAKICGRYTYGKPVQGDYKASVCQSAHRYWWRGIDDTVSDICVNFNGKLDKSGCHSIEVKSEAFKLRMSSMGRELKGEAFITEEATGIQLSTSSATSISAVINKVSFVDADTNYKPGIPYSVLIKVEDAGDNPISGTKVYLQSTAASINQTLLTNEKGQASFTLNTTDWNGRIFLGARTVLEYPPFDSGIINAEYGYASLTLSPFYSKSNSFLKLHSLDRVLPCEGTQEVEVEYIIKHTDLKKEANLMHLHYLVTSRRSIQDTGSLEIVIENSNEDLRGKTTLKLPLNAGTSSNLRALVYMLLPNGAIVADSAKFNILRCFKNKVSVGLSPSEVLPGSDVSLRVQAAPGSLCGLRVVDQSVVLMKPEKELTADKVYDLFPVHDFGEYDYRVQDFVNPCGFPHFQPLPFAPGLSPRRSIMPIIRPWDFDYSDVDVYSLFKYLKLKIITSADIKKPVKCFDRPFFGMAGPVGAMLPDVLDSPVISREIVNAVLPMPKEEKVEKVRKDFPETWIWQLIDVGISGNSELHHQAPDTITDWNAGAFCMGPTGFGLSAPASLRVFQPFFVDLTYPYSVVRGESFPLKAIVFNYLKQCIMVQITLQPTQELEQIPCAACQYSSCLCADESKTFSWSLKASKLGEVNITVRTEAVDTKEFCQNEITVVPKQGNTDTVIKPLLVQPGGVLEEKSHSSLLCIQEGEGHSKTEKVSLKVPDNILEDSERAHITVLGDLMGTAMQNLDRLLAMPYGCGEQNMVLFAPNIFILQYLEKTHQLNNEIKSKATRFLESGYQRQLTYKRDDGSYSAFGKNDPEGNTWLTAFVVKSFSKARPYIFIDDSHLNQSFNWLKNNRQHNGCFRSVGKLFNNAMKGGVEDEVSLSAYVTIALLEAGVSLEDSLVSDALSCLRKAAVDVNNVYTQALLFYTFTLCGDTDLSKTLMDKLDKKAVRGDGQLHWKRDTTPPSDAPYWSRAPSAEVELTGYMLLAFISSPTKDLGKASQIVNWLSKQQNPYGGYSSTQDTIVALQALSKYAECTYSDKGDMTVTVTSTSGFLEQFHVDKNNRLLLQRATLPAIPGEYTVTATGSGCVYVQTVLRYNIPPPKLDVTFTLSVNLISKTSCSKEPGTTFDILIDTAYTGPRVNSNMAVIEVKMLSGYVPVRSSIEQLEKSKIIQRSDIQNDIVTLYLNEIGPVRQIFLVSVEQEIKVDDLKPATVKVYDYYETDEQAIAEFNHPCSIDGE